MTILGIDISHHQGSFDVERASREGIDFFIFRPRRGVGSRTPGSPRMWLRPARRGNRSPLTTTNGRGLVHPLK